MRLTIRRGSDMGRTIGELRRKSKLTQNELSELVGIDAKYISKIESGRTVTLLEHELRIPVCQRWMRPVGLLSAFRA
jgi:transcriptional regulator with XRE-family HTH domain